MLKKLFTGILLGLLALWALYLYFMYAGDPSILWNRIQNHLLYTMIFFASIVAIYLLQWENKLFRFLIFVIIIINLFIIGDVFFRNNIGLDSRQFITLFVLIILALAITYITHRVRYILMGIVGIGITFVLLTWVLPLYENMPSINDFIISQKTKIINQGSDEWTVIIKNALGTKQIPVNQLTASDIDLSQKTQILLASKTKTGIEKIFVDLGNWSFININPQSAITLQQSGNETVMQILQWNIEYYIPSELSGAVQIIGKYKGQSIKDIQNNVRSRLVGQFEQKKEEFFMDEIGGDMVLNPVIDKVIKFFINTLYSISPETYQKNLNNYNNIQKYFWKTTTGDSQTTVTGTNIRNMIDDIMGQVKKWAEETQIKQRLTQ